MYELHPTRYDKVVAPLGGHGEFVTRVDQVGPAIERCLASGLPACINVPIASAAAPTASEIANKHSGGPGDGTIHTR